MTQEVGWDSCMVYIHRYFSKTKAKRTDTYVLFAFCYGMDDLVDDALFI